ncbi:MAG: hypothetical protein COA33_009005 [Fluviicola sp.]|nr:hypothetical protein [Fluviicola sp.]
MKLLTLLFCMSSFVSLSQEKLTWSILHPLKNQWVDLGKKGSVQEALIASGELPDPFYGKNEEKFNWIEEHLWEFKSMLFLKKEQFDKDFIEIEFPSVDTYAKVYLNDSLILTTENAFRPYSAQIKEFAKEGLNELTVIFTPPTMYHQQTFADASYHLPAPNDVGQIAVAPYTRKPQYQFGWDWSLRMNTMGFNKEVLVRSYNVARIVNKTTRVISISEERAIVEFDLFIQSDALEEIYWESKLFGNAVVEIKNGRFTRRVEISNPKLWWPRGQGNQFIYLDSTSILSIDFEIIENFELKFGIKQSELIQEKDEWGTSYYFKINGRRIFAKGADYIPQDIFPARVTDSAIVSMVEIMAESNFNMVRVWGGGYYPDDIFFEKCDELGIMVWQDLMFACAMYPGDAQFTCNVKDELKYQIPRISGHPSVVLFNGNNEVDVAWKYWGFQRKHNLYGKKAKEIEDAYSLVFKEIAPAMINASTAIPYIHTSPLSHWGKDKYYDHGSQHYWGVWHGKDPLEDFAKKIGRFNAEYGFQSFPEFNTLRSFSDEKDWDLKSDVMKHHQKSYVGNGMILKHAKLLYGEPKNFEEFVYFSQLTQAKAVSMAIAGHRIDAPRCGGTLYWQMNDCWPAPSWSSIDYFGNWKALQYAVKKDYEDIAIVAKYNGLNDKEYYVVSDFPEKLASSIICKIYDLSGKLISSEGIEYEVEQGSSQLLKMKIAEQKGVLDSNCVIKFSFNEGYSRTFVHIVKNYEKASEKDVDYSVASELSSDGKILLHINNSKFIQDVWISSTKQKVKFTTNFESFLPGHQLIEIDYFGELKTEDIKLMWR